ncbi:MAG: hypothetical protein RhofKO_09750 [Rhodothermales bacterium]
MQRKQFLHLMAAGATGLSLLPKLGTAQPRSSLMATKHWAWVRGDFSSMEPWKPKFERWKAAGIDAILPNVGTTDVLEHIVPVAHDAGLEVHAWIVTMMRGGMVETHPNWYAVNREGKSTAEAPPYVNYYRFLCPNRPDVHDHLAAHYDEMAQVPGVESMHLDYIRFPDVILPEALWPTYDLVQDQEYPPFDYCYCDVCRALFKSQTGLDPLKLDDPPSHAAWLQFRYDSITRIVQMLSEVVHQRDRLLTAAVFPTPTIAKRLVRQDWSNWPLDAVLPMIYHSFYNEDLAWIEASTREGVTALGGKAPLYAGLYVPALEQPEDLAEAARRAMAGGASGISLFEAQAPTEAHWNALAPVLKASR